jgi:hypothetical protein
LTKIDIFYNGKYLAVFAHDRLKTAKSQKNDPTSDGSGAQNRFDGALLGPDINVGVHPEPFEPISEKIGWSQAEISVEQVTPEIDV